MGNKSSIQKQKSSSYLGNSITQSLKQYRQQKEQEQIETHSTSLPNYKDIDLNELYENGYMVLKSHVYIPDKIIRSLLGFSDADGGAIFNHNEISQENDLKRRQYFIKPDAYQTKKFMDSLDRNLRHIFPSLYPNDWVILEAKPGCKPQAAHTDYFPPVCPLEIHEIPINVLIALQKNTSLNVWPKSHKLVSTEYLGDDVRRYDNDIKPIHKKVIKMEPGDMLLFRGDLVHAGAGYSELNFRMHCYLDYGYREPNKTWLVHRKGSEFLKKMIVIDP